MINFQIDHDHAILITEIYDQYDPETYCTSLTLKIQLAEEHGYFSELEIIHGQGHRSIEAQIAAGTQDLDFNDERLLGAVMKKVAYAYVADGHFWKKAMEVVGSIPLPYKTRAFNMIGRDAAFDWLKAQNAQRREQLAAMAREA
ncbi:MAG: hypothetical protein AAFU58_07445 [Pseudomonadota bacterium]